ncbi:MAG: prepilin-type N-terminal cleavage/methylation domain-containing protein [Calditrichaeota bacterium]|nr:MAG: prepilin-type N-terminal cleavage/methylation domain-containing protein [Calditrichota bacterium]
MDNYLRMHRSRVPAKGARFANEQGFTLIEAMIALTLFTVVGLAALALLKQGMAARKALTRVAGQLQQRRQLNLQLQQDLAALSNSVLQPFKGKADSLQFLTRRQVAGEPPALCRVTYFTRYSPEGKEVDLFRWQEDFTGFQEEKRLIRGVKSWQLAYLQIQNGNPRWMERWMDRSDLPVAFRIRYRLLSDPEINTLIFPLRGQRQVFSTAKRKTANVGKS